MNPELSIIIVSWNVKELLEKCLKSIYKYKTDLFLEIIVVDNASTDKTIEMIKKNFPKVKLIINDINKGFAKANNQGILASQGEFILLLNPDTEIIKNSLEKMMDFMKKHYQAGIAGCKHLNSDWTIQPSVRRFPNFWSLFFIFTKMAKIFPQIPTIYYYLAKDLNLKIAQPVDQVAGSFFLMRRKVIDEIGLFDENFFIWFEEVDYCLRAKKAGWQIWYNPEAEIIHYGGKSFNQILTFKKQKMFFKSAKYYLQKHGPKTPKFN